MAEPALLAPSSFDLPHHNHRDAAIDPSDPPFFDPDLFSDDLPLPADPSFDDFDIDVDFSVDDFLLSPERRDGSPSPEFNEGSGASSSSLPPASAADAGGGPASPDSGHSAAGSPDSGVCAEGSGKARRGVKRKKQKEDAGSPNPNPSPNISPESNSASCVDDAGDEDEDKRKARLMRNRESAQLSRQRKKLYVEELEEKVKSMHSTINELNAKISYIMAENLALRQQVGGNAGPNCPPQSVYPMAPLHFPWIPGYSLRQQGSQVPLVPIPRLKPQQPAPAPKAKKSESKKGEKSRTKKLASISLLGLLFVALFFGAVVPGVTRRIGESRNSVSDQFDVGKSGNFGGSHGRVLSVSSRGGSSNSTDQIELCGGKFNFGESGTDGITGKKCQPGISKNSSESLPALLYVPRNGKHVKINGNLIIHSVLASERAMAHRESRDQVRQSTSKENNDTSLALASYVASSLAVSESGKEMGKHFNSYRGSVEHLRALASDSGDAHGKNMKSSLPDGSLPQWFSEGMAGPILSSGMCTEVFQFEVSPASAQPSGIVPATSIANASSILNSTENLHRSRHTGKIKNRRIMYKDPIPLTGKTLNNTEKPSESQNSHDNKLVSSVVVSILADPREAGDGDGGDGRISSPKSLSRIFVVVLLDSVKYVTYSCVLPFKSSGPHLVN
ncbi:bZIP transcription factor 39-like [Ananas comosus]|uniref:BZIP transcription factor 39-like n=2 Tax=Ananas comosus TaxID=4615 RepID=A0A6P5ESV5_ANACO|nr:bZIP transcription factor 39-like [Ananas comosus]